MVAVHIKKNPGHSIKYPDSLQILLQTSNKQKAQAYEAYHIYQQSISNPHKLLNKKEDIRNSIIYKTITEAEARKESHRPLPRTLGNPSPTMGQGHSPKQAPSKPQSVPSRPRVIQNNNVRAPPSSPSRPP